MNQSLNLHLRRHEITCYIQSPLLDNCFFNFQSRTHDAIRNFAHPSVCWSVSPSVCRSVGLLGRYFGGPLDRQSMLEPASDLRISFKKIGRQIFEGKSSVSPYFLHYYQNNYEAGMLLVNNYFLKTQCIHFYHILT